MKMFLQTTIILLGLLCFKYEYVAAGMGKLHWHSCLKTPEHMVVMRQYNIDLRACLGLCLRVPECAVVSYWTVGHWCEIQNVAIDVESYVKNGRCVYSLREDLQVNQTLADICDTCNASTVCDVSNGVTNSSCKIQNCPELFVPPGSVVYGNMRHVGAKRKIVITSGPGAGNSSTQVCQADGTWSNCTYSLGLAGCVTDAYPNTKTLMPAEYELYWRASADTIVFEVHVTTHGWVGIGISSEEGSMTPADVTIGKVLDSNGECQIGDYSNVAHKEPEVDSETNVQLLACRQIGTGTMLKFARPVTSPDPDDMAFLVGGNFLIYAFGETDTLSYHKKNKHFQFIKLL